MNHSQAVAAQWQARSRFFKRTVSNRQGPGLVLLSQRPACDNPVALAVSWGHSVSSCLLCQGIKEWQDKLCCRLSIAVALSALVPFQKQVTLQVGGSSICPSNKQEGSPSTVPLLLWRVFSTIEGNLDVLQAMGSPEASEW